VTELHDSQPLDDVEALVRLAGNYVRASDDLRPRVLETARSQHGQRRARRRIWQSAVCVLLLGLFVTSVFQQPALFGTGLETNSGSAQLISGVETVTREVDSSWGIVESFTELRRRQAELLRLAL
jgi:hypothetical protein